MRIAIVTNVREQKGLYRDGLILQRLLEPLGHDVSLVDFRDAVTRDRRYGLVIHLELCVDRAFWWADEHWWIPNLEWVKPEYLTSIDAFRYILCKTKEAHRVLSPLSKRAVYTGFESEDRYDPSVKRERRFFYNWGGNIMRGANAVKRAWGIGDCVHPATFLLRTPIRDEDLLYEQNRCMFHLMPFQVEGYGHILHEAFGVGALTAVTDGPPMNESAGITLKLRAKRLTRQRLADVYEVAPATVAEAAGYLWNMPDSEGVRLMNAARDAFHEERAAFRRAFAALLE